MGQFLDSSKYKDGLTAATSNNSVALAFGNANSNVFVNSIAALDGNFCVNN